MMKIQLLSSLAVASVACGPVILASPPAGQTPYAPGPRAADVRLGTIATPSAAQAKAQAFSWLAQQKASPDTLAQAEAIWSEGGQTQLDRTIRILALGQPAVAEVLANLRSESAPRPTELPPLFRDSPPGFFRANLGLALAKAFVDRRFYEEGLLTLKAIQPEQVVDPASYYFFKAVCENRLLLKTEGLQSIHRLLASIPDAPERYRSVAALMQDEMEKWEDQDLAYIARRMQEIEGRLDIGRAGPKTQEKQKEVLDLLDKKIEELESQCQQCQGGGGGAAPKSAMPAPDSKIMQTAGPGKVDNKKLVKDAKGWGNMPEKEKIKALESLSRGYPPHFKEAIEGYTKKVAEGKEGGQRQ